jgi:3',5'-cyclic AMP phosphodiesterase CpdA
MSETRDGVGRRRVLECMAWAGTGLVWSLSGGVPGSRLLTSAEAATSGFSFVQLSDDHIGFAKEANPDVTGTLRKACDLISKLPRRPDFIIHTGDVSHLSKPEELDIAKQVIGQLGIPLYVVPGEHDMLIEDGATFRERFGKDTKGAGWFSFDHAGVHFVGLVNVVDLKAGGLGNLGAEQLDWLAKDLKSRSASTPVVVFAHIPLWTVYEAWGWGTEDGAKAMALLARFDSVTVLNGHIHQIVQKVEGNFTFHTARATGFPQPAPGTAPSPGPMKVPADDAGLHRCDRGSRQGATRDRRSHPGASLSPLSRRLLLAATAGILAVLAGPHAPAHDMAMMADAPPPGDPVATDKVSIDNFAFTPAIITVKAGTTVTWTNHDDIPHLVVAQDHSYRSKPLDTDDSFSRVFDKPGEYPYFCGLHPKMTGVVRVQ